MATSLERKYRQILLPKRAAPPCKTRAKPGNGARHGKTPIGGQSRTSTPGFFTKQGNHNINIYKGAAKVNRAPRKNISWDAAHSYSDYMSPIDNSTWSGFSSGCTGSSGLTDSGFAYCGTKAPASKSSLNSRKRGKSSGMRLIPKYFINS